MKFTNLMQAFFMIFSTMIFFWNNEITACSVCDVPVSRDWDAQGLSTKQGFALDISGDFIDQNEFRYGKRKVSKGISPEAALSYVNSQPYYRMLGKSTTAGAQQIVNNGINNNEYELWTKTKILNIGLNYTGENWGVNMTIPYINRTHATNGAVETVEPGMTFTYAMPGLESSYWHQYSSFSAPGDIRILARYSGFTKNNFTGILYGIKLPSGQTDLTFNDGEHLDRSLQPGTGSIDASLGGYLTGSIERMGWFMQGLYQKSISVTKDFRPGDTFSASIGMRYGNFGQSVVPMLQFNYINRQPDTGSNATRNTTKGLCPNYGCVLILGENPPNPATEAGISSKTDIFGKKLTGAQAVYLAPGLSVRLGEGTSAYGFIQIPIYQNVNSLQLTADEIVSIGVKHNF
jgi:hypothetical protein